MKSSSAVRLLLSVTYVFAFVSHTCGESLIGPIPAEQRVASGAATTTLECSVTGIPSPNFVWLDDSGGTAVIISINGGSSTAGYENFVASVDGTSTTMTISNIQLDNEGIYACQVPPLSNTATITVEVQSTLSDVSITTPLENDVAMVAGTTYNIQCDAVGGKPQESIEWYLNGASQPAQDDVETYVTNSNDSKLTDTNSVFTFMPSAENDEDTLSCGTSGHLAPLTGLNQMSKTVTLNVRYPPGQDIMEVVFVIGDDLTVNCSLKDGSNQPNPVMTFYYIYANDSLIHESESSVNSVSTDIPQGETDFKCVGGNYLGNTTATETYTPGSTGITTPSPTTGAITTEAPDPTGSLEGGAPIGAIVGAVIGAIVVIAIIVVVLFFFTSVCDGCKHGSSGTGSSTNANKVSNGSKTTEQEAPLKIVNEFGTESVAPKAAPRQSQQIKHTTDNPEQAAYAMVDKRPTGGGGGGGGDDNDGGHNGKGAQPDGGMHYADIDLSHQAGHTERHVPQNEKDVVVYSSILV